jgi:hypothetical protein
MSLTSSRREPSGGLIGGGTVIARLARAVLGGSSPVRLAPPADPSGRSYVVAGRLRRWRVTYEDAPIGTFDDPAEATRFACDVARIEAQAGVSTSVEVQAAVLERHYFVSSAAGGGLPPRSGG